MNTQTNPRPAVTALVILPGKAGFRLSLRRFLTAVTVFIGTALTANIASGQNTWAFDPAFQRSPLRLTSESASGVKVLSSGKVLTYTINGALMSGANGQRIGALVRLDPDTGAIDPTWNVDPTLTGRGFLGVAEAADFGK